MIPSHPSSVPEGRGRTLEMADRNSAEIFSTLFNELASEYGSAVSASEGGYSINVAVESLYRLAKKMWAQTFHYDFAHYQMECDASLIQLDLARRTSEGIEYRTRGLDGWEEA